MAPYPADSSVATPSVSLLTPGAASLEWLTKTISELKSGDPFCPVTIVTPNFYSARFILRYLARHGGAVNVRALRLGAFAAALTPPGADPRQSLTPLREASAVRAALTGAGARLLALADYPSLQSALQNLFRELRRREADAGLLLQDALGEMAASALRCYQAFSRLTSGYADGTALRQRAVSYLSQLNAGGLDDVGALVLFLPTRLDPVDLRLLAAVARLIPFRAAFPFFCDSSDRGDELGVASARALADLLSVPLTGDTPGAGGDWVANLRVVRAPSPAEEAREVIRRIVEDLEAGVPLYQIAVLYRQADPYAQVIREALDFAGIPWSAFEGRRLLESLPGRALLALLDLRRRRFARGAVIAWLDAIGDSFHGDGGPGAALWDRISREAGVTGGLAQWQNRLNAHARLLEQRAEDGGRLGLSAAGQEALRRDADTVRRMLERLLDLDAELHPPSDGSPWSTFVDWTLALWERWFADPETWPDADREFLAHIRKAVDELRDAGHFQLDDAGPTYALFVATLESALANQSLPVGRLGEGAMLGPVQDVAGLTFARVYIMGLTESAFPSPPQLDPFFAGSGIDPLESAERHRLEERTRFLTAISAARDGHVTLTTPDAFGGRASFPSRYLLQLVATRLGQASLETAEFRRLRESDHDWLRSIQSAEDGMLHARVPADLEDLRLRQAADWTRSGRSLRTHPLVSTGALAQARALDLSDERRGVTFTRFDGNVGALSGHSFRLSRHLTSDRAVSTSAAERWATCPFRYFLGDVLGVKPVPRPEETWTVNPLERGSLVHAILFDFYTKTQALEGNGDSTIAPAERAIALDEIANHRFAEAVERGVTGHPLVWENTRASLLADLQTYVRLDAGRLQQEGMRPSLFEQPFGMTAEGWPEVAIEAGGVKLRFRGSIDRVDLDSAHGRVEVLDYKTGLRDEYRGLAADPVLAGKHLQLAVYALAARNGLVAAAGDVRSSFSFVTSRGGFVSVPISEDTEMVQARLQEVLGIIVEGVRQGAFPQVPGNADRASFRNCSHCDFDRLCPAARDDAWTRKSRSDGYLQHAGLSPAETGP